jgi:hypothetical protein
MTSSAYHNRGVGGVGNIERQPVKAPDVKVEVRRSIVERQGTLSSD